MSRAGLKLGAAGLGGGAAAAAAAAAASGASWEDAPRALKLCGLVPLRLLRDSCTAACIAFDYQYSCWGVQQGSDEWARIRHAVHLRSAHRLQDLCFRNGGIYIKLGQHLAQLDYVVPQEYVQTMRESMLKRCPVSSYDQVRRVFIKELGQPPEDVFLLSPFLRLFSLLLSSLCPIPSPPSHSTYLYFFSFRSLPTSIRCLSLALLLHKFMLLEPMMDARLLSRWLVEEVRESSPKELNFLHEARNSEKCVDNFKRLSPHIAESIYAPKVYWNLSTPRLLTMEFMEAAEVTDVKAIKKHGLRPHDVSKLVSKAFAEMMFKHGFVHCDPHAANLMVRPLPKPVSWWSSFFKRRKPQLILLDHGLYKELDFDTRTSYAALWKGLVFADEKAIRENSINLGAGEDLYVLFAGVLTMRPWKRVIDPSVDHLALRPSHDDRSELQMYAAQYFPQISELLRRLPRVILLMLKTNDCLRALNHDLVEGSPLESFLIIGRVSSEAVLDAKRMINGSNISSRFRINIEHLFLEARLLAMKLAIWLLLLRNSLPLRWEQ
ncbi:Protein kinase superfamily protein [Rhynchospora pubera]|uniref:Protein kinase superfamily protein n=1 Tax=Rhynchospora pubera TaxID=906938 RepID=A0AAV8D1U5_9POAL|nr:Protein kinase superfamily protein [Rhynchospora pubera]